MTGVQTCALPIWGRERKREIGRKKTEIKIEGQRGERARERKRGMGCERMRERERERERERKTEKEKDRE